MKEKINSLPTRRFGRTELNIPVLSLGGMRFQHSWSDLKMEKVSAENQQKLEEILKFSVQNGIHHVETARHYGTSELQLGFGIQEFPDINRILQTKIPPREDPSQFELELERSFSNLQCKKLDLLSIHGLNLPKHLHQTIRPGGCLEVARRWQDRGLVDHIGFSTHGPTDLIVKAIESDEFDYVNLHWYFIFQDNEPALAAAAKLDLGVFIISPTDKGGHLHSPSEKLVKLCSPLHPIVFNDLFCLNDQRVHTLSVGASNIEDFALHLHAVSLLDKADKFLPKLQHRLAHAAKKELGEEWLLTWKKGLPSWDQTPGNINIPILIWLYNLDKAWGMESYAKARYSLLGNGSHWFPGANLDCLDKHVSEDRLKKALNLSPWGNEIIQKLRELKLKFQGESSNRLSIS